MKGRGRQSLADSATVVTGAFGKRPDPPDGLTERQCDIWREIVASEDPNFFDSAALRALLADYCRHRESAEKLAVVLNQFKTEWLNNPKALSQYRTLVRTRDIETRATVTMATKLRLTNQSRYVPHAAATAARRALKGPRPWEETG